YYSIKNNENLMIFVEKEGPCLCGAQITTRASTVVPDVSASKLKEASGIPVGKRPSVSPS
ncbi:MAG: hypothetical protein ACI4SY_06935, partial [Sutterella sp.]